MKIKNILYFFLESCLFTVFLFSTLCSFTFLNPYYMIHIFQKNDIYELISQNTLKEMQNYIYQSGFDEEVLDNLFTTESIKNSFNEMTISIYKNKPFLLDTHQLEENLNQNIVQVLEKNNIESYDNEALNNFKKEIMDTYKNNLDLKSFVRNIPEYMIVVSNITLTIMLVSLMGVIFIYILLKENRRKAISIILFFASCVFFFFYFWGKESLNIESLQFFNEYVSKLLSVLLKNLLQQFLGIALICSSIGILTCKEKKSEIV